MGTSVELVLDPGGDSWNMVVLQGDQSIGSWHCDIDKELRAFRADTLQSLRYEMSYNATAQRTIASFAFGECYALRYSFSYSIRVPSILKVACVCEVRHMRARVAIFRFVVPMCWLNAAKKLKSSILCCL
jgi:hypothetical protein